MNVVNETSDRLFAHEITTETKSVLNTLILEKSFNVWLCGVGSSFFSCPDSCCKESKMIFLFKSIASAFEFTADIEHNKDLFRIELSFLLFAFVQRFFSKV